MRSERGIAVALAALLVLPAWAQETEPAAPAPEAPALPAATADLQAEQEPEGITIVRDEDGVSLSGVAPSVEAEAELLARAREIAGNGAIVLNTTILREGSREDWEALIASALDALGGLVSGVAVVRPDSAVLSGVAEDPGARDTVLELLGESWEAQIGVQLELADPYLFTAEKSEEGNTYSGHAPDQETEARIEAAVDGALGADAAGGLTLASGMPSETWPDLVAAAVDSLAEARTGRVEIVGEDVSLTAAVPDAGARSRLVEKLGTGWQVDVTVADEGPEPELTLEIGENGKLTARGRLPERIGRGALVEMLGPIETPEGLSSDAYGEVGPWRDALDSLAIAVPRLASGEIMLGDGIARFGGVLKPGFSANELRGALRATLGSAWTVEIDTSEAPPPSHLEIVRTPDGVDVAGILPDGVTAERLLGILGETDTTHLSSGGEGDSSDWQQQLRITARALHAFETGRAELDGRTVALTGTLAPGYSAAEVGSWLDERLGKDWDVAVEAEDRPAEAGARRVDFETGSEEELQGGRWLPLHDFPVSAPLCATKLAEVQRGQRVTFVPGSTEIGGGQERLLDRMAGVIKHCLSEGDVALEVQGHTDDRGEADENLALSEKRALSVVEALTARGAPAEGLTGVGYGETRPIADNESEEGRALNRRISFEWGT